jgi:uncharacterized repeat protein (TIGR01451 family)
VQCQRDIGTFHPDAGVDAIADAPVTDAPPAHALAITVGAGSLTSWDFGSQVAGTSSTALAITVTNDTDQVSDVLAVHADPAFPIDAASTCPVGIELAPGASCSIFIRFRPAAEGAQAGALAVNGGPAVGSATLDLTGTGVAAADLDTDPPFIDFGVVELGTTQTQTIAIVNSGEDVAIQSIHVGDPIGSGFTLQSTTCAGTLVAGARCDLVTTFTPTALGQDSGDLTVQTDRGAYAIGANWLMGEGGARLTVQISGAGSVTSDGGGVPDIDCGPDCTGLFVNGLAHQLVASGGSVVWGGAGSACLSSSCPVMLSTSGPTLVTATFTP